MMRFLISQKLFQTQSCVIVHHIDVDSSRFVNQKGRLSLQHKASAAQHVDMLYVPYLAQNKATALHDAMHDLVTRTGRAAKEG